MTEQGEQKQLSCPYCDEEIISADLPYCQACRITIFYCPKCRKLLSRDNRICPNCGADIRLEVAKGNG